jgi:hypothetical protein
MSAMLALAFLAFLSANAQDKTSERKDDSKKGIGDQIKWETKDFESAIQTELGLKMKSLSLVSADTKSSLAADRVQRVKLLLEFDKDGDPDKVHVFFRSRRVEIDYGDGYLGWAIEREGRLMLSQYDDENVCITKLSPPPKLDGQITGKKGEAFRVYLPVHSTYTIDAKLSDVKRIELRFHPRLDIQNDKNSTEISKAIKWETGEFQKTLEGDYGLKLKSVSVVSVGQVRHVMLDCERIKATRDLKAGGALYQLAGFFDRPFKNGTGGLQCQFYANDNTPLEVVKNEPKRRSCCFDDPQRFNDKAVGNQVVIFVRAPAEMILTKTTRAVIRVTAAEKLRDEPR